MSLYPISPESEIASDSERIAYRRAWRRAHSRLIRERGSARDYKCECGRQAEQWARIWRLGLDVSDLSGCVPMCKKCHREYDKELFVLNAKRHKPWLISTSMIINGWQPCDKSCRCHCHVKAE